MKFQLNKFKNMFPFAFKNNKKFNSNVISKEKK